MSLSHLISSLLVCLLHISHPQCQDTTTLVVFPCISCRQSNIKTVEKNLQSDCLNFYLKDLQDNKAEGYVLQSFLDEWPKSQRENTDSINYTVHPASTTHLSISAPGNQSSDFSLKLSTGIPEKPGQDNNNGCEIQLLAQPSNKGTGWVSYGHGQASVGGPLAEALRSSASTHSPTSVLHSSNGSISEISSISPWEASLSRISLLDLWLYISWFCNLSYFYPILHMSSSVESSGLHPSLDLVFWVVSVWRMVIWSIWSHFSVSDVKG